MEWILAAIYTAIGFGVLCYVSYLDGKHKRKCIGTCFHDYEVAKGMAVPMWPLLLLMIIILGLAAALAWCLSPLGRIIGYFEKLGRGGNGVDADHA